MFRLPAYKPVPGLGEYLSHPFANCAKGWGTRRFIPPLRLLRINGHSFFALLFRPDIVKFDLDSEKVEHGEAAFAGAAPALPEHGAG